MAPNALVPSHRGDQAGSNSSSYLPWHQQHHQHQACCPLLTLTCYPLLPLPCCLANRAVVQDRALQDADPVVWHSFGVTHLPRLEDFPISEYFT